MNQPTSQSSPDSPTAPRRGGGGNPLRWIVMHTRGLIYNQRARRLTMFYTVLAAMLMIFASEVLLRDWLNWHEHWQRFVVYWLVCGWLTILAALLALYDMLLLRVQHRLLRRKIREEILGREDLSSK